eukprot:CAMPEP_0194026590 /NCGR_PEP_ID=MMETSP0009_2-20130614/891_1 /TAXON_ID=210454 /ORGANISM="Grammatophora oceanica, Strain CCMP 410" /LENGTH=370 /DNA_ID=CAMNT_0038665363 /DNA_START=36 /DNA_END=1148 /DNA_ORIENTATION=+
MKLSVLALVSFLCSSSSNASASDVPNNAAGLTSLLRESASSPLMLELTELFQTWSMVHQKDYSDYDEALKRRDVWIENDAKIRRHNNQVPTPSYTLGHNEYSDLTLEEFRTHFSLSEMPTPPTATKEIDAIEEDYVLDIKRSMLELTLPDYVNWIDAGAVTDIKNQGACGSCWAFSTTGALEGAKFLKTGELTPLSEQNLLDCDHQDLGCNGGLMDNAFKFDEKSGGLCSETDYPYEAVQHDTCKTDCTDVPGSIVKTFVDVPPGDERALLSAIAMQPISVAIQADQMAFQFYKDGILDDDTCGKSGSINHGVLAVGYGTDLDTQTPYWIVKNSWGETWGDDGYVKISRASENEFGMCAILKLASFPVTE